LAVTRLTIAPAWSSNSHGSAKFGLLDPSAGERGTAFVCQLYSHNALLTALMPGLSRALTRMLVLGAQILLGFGAAGTSPMTVSGRRWPGKKAARLAMVATVNHRAIALT